MSVNITQVLKQIKLKAGKARAESVNIWHYGVNRDKVDVEFIVVFAGYEGAPQTMSLGTRITTNLADLGGYSTKR